MANTAAPHSSTPDATPHHFQAADAGSPSAFAFAMLTHPGRVRHANQDACAAAPEHAAFVVCDGVGGAAGGEIASQLAAESFLDALRSSATNDRAAHSSHDVSRAMSGEMENSSHPHTRLSRAVLAANAAVFERAQKTRTLRGMASTLVAALLEYPPAAMNDGVPDSPHLEEMWDGTATNDGVPHPYESARMGGMNPARPANSSPGAPPKLGLGGREPCPTLWLAHAGDSRAYRLRRTPNSAAPTLQLLTRDHSLVEEQVRAGILTRHDALRSPMRNVITRAVGSQPTVEPEIAYHAIEPGDVYLLASDGLTRELTDPAIARILTEAVAHERTTAALQVAAHALIDAANHQGGRDNITVLLLACR